MMSLTNKHILLGVGGSIAAYKSAELIRLFRKSGAHVRVVMTDAALEFITPLTLQALSGHPVHHTLLDDQVESAMGHIELARWADLLLIAPASANIMARLVMGVSNDLLTTLSVACCCDIALAPAMNQAMWHAPSTKRNTEQLRVLFASRLHMLGPAEGEQACGDMGLGRMLAPDDIVKQTALLFETGGLAGLNVVITAGPTQENIDPVRYISNRSSGKMGYALAQAAAEAGARVTLISGPVSIQTPDRVKCIHVLSAKEMLASSLEVCDGCDVFIATAAVSDYRPRAVSEQKIKKNNEMMTLELVKNPDIVSQIAQQIPRPFVVGFAAETQKIKQYAMDKRINKQLDMIIVNDVSKSDVGFNSSDNEVWVLSKDREEWLPKQSKTTLARTLIDLIAKQCALRTPVPE
jgi:phosphopantothenoylcysteine decarboxylase/phosphopantothenate--cysteine ligase